jgi:hypothetical protein
VDGAVRGRVTEERRPALASVKSGIATETAQMIASWLPIIFMTVAAFVFSLTMARRKGVHPLLCLQVLIPIWGYFFLYWLVSRADADVLRRLEALERERTFK